MLTKVNCKTDSVRPRDSVPCVFVKLNKLAGGRHICKAILVQVRTNAHDEKMMLGVKKTKQIKMIEAKPSRRTWPGSVLLAKNS